MKTRSENPKCHLHFIHIFIDQQGYGNECLVGNSISASNTLITVKLN